MNKWDIRMMRLAREVASWSKDPSTRFGAVVAVGKRVVGMGYNGFPPQVADDDRLHDRAEKYELVVHAEVNAVLNAGLAAKGGTLYMYGAASAPCRNCTKHVLASGIARVVGCGPAIPDRWREQVEASARTLREAGVSFEILALEDL